MASQPDVQEAIRRSILTEKHAMEFYRRGAALMQDPEARRTFELLSREEREHAREFFDIYPGGDLGDFETFISRESEEASEWLSDLNQILLPDFSERRAMELAMEKEQRLEKHLREMAARMNDPEVRAVYEANARSTHNHYLLIESEYARLMGMVHETDMDTFVRE